MFGFSFYRDWNDLRHIGHALCWCSGNLMHRYGFSFYRDWNDLSLIGHGLCWCSGDLMGFLFTGIGMILAALAMVYAGVLEIYRKKDIEANGPIVQSLGKDDFNASKLSMFVQVPEFAFIGSSEVFASISGESGDIAL